MGVLLALLQIPALVVLMQKRVCLLIIVSAKMGLLWIKALVNNVLGQI
jgi:hypothetical protein